MKATTSGGVTIEPTDDEEADLIVDEVVSDLVTLEEVGLVSEDPDDEDTFHFHPSLLILTPPVVAALVEE